MKRLITVLGLGRLDPGSKTRSYEETTYAFPSGQQRRGSLFAAMAATEYEVERIDCLATEDAWEAHGKALEDASPAPVERHAVDAIGGEADLWRLFQTVVDIPQAGDRLVLDVTHGFRTMPLIGVVAASVATLTKDATIEGLLYGAFDQRDTGTNVTQVIDLMPFYNLLQWQAACAEFARTGLAGGLLAALSDETRLPGSVASFQQHAGELALALTMMNPSAAQESARELAKAVKKVDTTPTGEKIPPVPPAMRAVAGWVGEACAPLLQHDCAGAPEDRLRHEAALIRWYRDRGHYTQAATLLREWLVSLAGWALLGEYPVTKKQRDRAESAIVSLNWKRQHRKGKCNARPLRVHLQRLRSQSWLPALLDTWETVTNARNNITHCAMRREPDPPRTHKDSLDALVPDRLDALLAQAHLNSSR